MAAHGAIEPAGEVLDTLAPLRLHLFLRRGRMDAVILLSGVGRICTNSALVSPVGCPRRSGAPARRRSELWPQDAIEAGGVVDVEKKDERLDLDLDPIGRVSFEVTFCYRTGLTLSYGGICLRSTRLRLNRTKQVLKVSATYVIKLRYRMLNQTRP